MRANAIELFRFLCQGFTWQLVHTGRRGSVSLSAAVKEGETATEQYERRLKESLRVEERVVSIDTDVEFRQQLDEVRLSLTFCKLRRAILLSTPAIGVHAVAFEFRKCMLAYHSYLRCSYRLLSQASEFMTVFAYA